MSATAAHDQQVDAIISTLVAAWRQVFRVMTVGQAQAALGLPLDTAVRLRVAERLAATPQLSPIIRRWGVPALVLTNEEKLLGRALERLDGPVSSAALAQETGVVLAEVQGQLAVLAHSGLVAASAIGYRLAEGWQQRLGPLGWTFHEVQLEREPAYNVPCAVDFLLLAQHAYPDRRLTIADTCAWSDTPIHATIAHGAVTGVEPAAALVFPGGG